MFEINNYNYNDDWTNTNPDIPKFDYNSFYRAIVESIDDPEHIGRIKVRIPSLHGESDVSTLPYAYPAIFAGLGNQVGQFILPPVGSIVFVAFEYSNEHRPIYFGGIPTKLGDSDQEQYYGPRINKGQPKLVTSDDIPQEYTGSEYIIYKSPSGSIIYIDDNDYNPEIVVKDSVGQELRFTSNDIKDTELDGAIYLKHDSKNYIKVSQDEIILCVAGVEYKAPFSGGGGGTTDYDLLIHKPILNTSNNTSLSTNSEEEIKGTISLHKVSKTGSYNDLLNKPTIPTKTSQLTNDSNYATIDIIPTKVSDLQNDAGYITGYTETDPTVPTHVKNITQQNITDWNNKSTFSGDYNDLTNKPSIPSKVSDLVNDEGYTDNIGTITEVQTNGTSISTSGVANIPAATTETYGVTKLSSSTNSTSNSLAATTSAVKSAYDLANTANTQASTNATNITSLQTNKADKSELPTKTSDLTNDSGFITSEDVPAQVQSDWNQTTTTAKDFIKNKPNLSAYETKSNKVAISSTATADQYPNAKSVYDFVTDSISTIPQGLKIPVSISKESDLPTTASNGDYYYIQNMDTTAPGHTGRAWYNNQWYKVYDQYNSMDGISIVQSGGGSWQVSTEWLHGVLPVDSSLSSTSTNPVQNKVINTVLGNKVDKVSGKGLSTNDLTDSLKTKYDEAANKIDQIIVEGGEPNVIEIVKVNNTALTPDANKAVNVTVPTKTSDLTNDSGFITSTVNNLTNYYAKTDTYTKTEVNNLIGSISSLDIEVVQTLPSSDISTSTIYLLPKSSSEQQNIYDEYIYVNNSWELIGSTAIDLSNYYTSTQVDNLLSNKASKSLYSDTTINVGRKSNTTVGSSSTAEGIDTTASGTASHAEGEYTVANSKAQHVFGRYNISDTNDDNTDYGDYVEIVGNGSYNTPSNARTLDWSGNETLAGDSTVGGTVKATKGIWSRPTGEVGTATSDSNSCLLIKRANNTEAPNNGVVLEFGNSANWRGQLYIGDNATQGIYYNGWSNGVRGSWRRLADEPVVLYNNTSGTNGNLTLSESAANFTYLEVFYQYGGTNDYTSYTSSKIYAPNGKKINLDIYLAGSSGTNIQFYTSVYTINGTSMTLSNWYGNGNINNNAVSAVSKTAAVRVVRVIGYR